MASPAPKSTGWIVRHLARVTSSGEFIAEIDGIRFLAILAVLIYHTAIDVYLARGAYGPGWDAHHGIVLRLIGAGWFGVEIFFLLSGFIVALPFARAAIQGAAAPDLGRYFLRRVTRIEPPYILSLTAMYLLSGEFSRYLPDYLASLVYSHQYVFAAANPFAIVTWSLEVEVAFYILAPWLTRVYRIRRNGARWLTQLLLIGSCGLADRWLTHHGPARIQDTLVTAIPFFLGGMLLADLYASGRVRRSGQFGWDIAAASSIILLAKAVPSRWYWVSPLLVMLLVAGIIGGRIANSLFRLRPVTLVGGMCYTLYLWHGFLLILIPLVAKRQLAGLPYVESAVVYSLIVVPSVIVACVPIFLLIEKPFMNGSGSRYVETRLRSIVAALHRRTPVASDAVH